MATTNGVANGAAHLWDILLKFVTENGWEILSGPTKRVSETNRQLSFTGVHLRGIDFNGRGNILVHAIFYEDLLNDIYAFQFEGSAAYRSGADVTKWGELPLNSYCDVGLSSKIIVNLPLHRNPIQYWLTCSPRRFMGAFRHNDRWGSLYAGFILPYALPQQYPYPLFIGANNFISPDYKLSYGGCVHGASLCNSGVLCLPDGKWVTTPFESPNNIQGGRSYGVAMWPQKSHRSEELRRIKPAYDSSGVERYALLKHVLYSSRSEIYGTYGELDGICYVTSWGAAGGDTLKSDGKTWLLFQREQSTASESAAALLLE